ncbi:MAG: hypothetical protein K6G23_06555 [Lachnospiraceae bacterium]|nr:hypothetical protein [Lachnospiraceae bacterium]
MSIVLLSLKIIGIIIAICLALILLLLLIPIRYRIDVKGTKEDLHIAVLISVLKPLIRVMYAQPTQPYLLVKILMFTAFDSRKTVEEEPGEAPDAPPKEKFTFQVLCDKMRQGFEQIGQIRTFLSEEEVSTLIELLKVELWSLLCYAAPRISGSLTYGNADPAITGEVLGVYSMLLPLHQRSFDFVADFEQERLDVDLCIRGRIRLIRLLFTALNLLIRGKLLTVVSLWKQSAPQPQEPQDRGEEVYE